LALVPFGGILSEKVLPETTSEDAPVTFQSKRQTEDRIERSTPHLVERMPPDAQVQRKRMLVALGILLLALVAVVLKDWDFWFPTPSESNEVAARNKSKVVATTPAISPEARVVAPAKDSKAPKVAAVPAAEAPPFSATTERAALPPLQVEVVAGNHHIKVPAKSSAIHLDVGPEGISAASGGAETAGAVTPNPAADVKAANAGAHVQLSPQTAQSVAVSVPPDYPLLARQMKVQGAVSLQALISREGTIQELQILSGPAILAAAAREAVKQWHFKPYLINGQPVATQAHITVNFTISTN
jgi:periplasmic protein TonB